MFSIRTLGGQRVTEEELRAELGQRLRDRRSSQGRTLASVAMQAGLSVPYVANLENGRGNPTLGSLHRLADALGIRLSELLAEGDGTAAGPAALPESLAAFSRGARFGQEVRRLAAEGKVTPAEVRHKLLTAMAAVPQPHRGLDELDWHRTLDALVLVLRPR
jgi:transcriptional regulator with XRE-family HTH domain